MTGSSATGAFQNIDAELRAGTAAGATRTAADSVAKMPHGRVLLLEDDPGTRNLLLDLFQEEEIDATICGSLRELQAAITSHPGAVVVSDSWSGTDNQAVSRKQRSEIIALGRSAAVILTTARSWASSSADGEFGTVIVLPKPYDLDQLMALIRPAFASDTQLQA